MSKAQSKAQEIKLASAQSRALSAMFAIRELVIACQEELKFSALNLTAENATKLVDELDELRDVISEAAYELRDQLRAELDADDEAALRELRERTTVVPEAAQ